ncbi:HAD family hydrolase [Pedobacter sp. L105]|uniref:HAD family hydrolase n=1 Tax=Pedobacter sp. L105 TaxID=1641871 RepID=UPI00131D23FB|nr:HAD family hydrolase [Pedobacter sp. L105]
MKPYKHYSFDLWLTLIRSNPQWKLERAKIFHTRYNPLKKSFEEVVTIFRQVDLMVNSINEKTGKNIDADEMYLMVISIINNFEPGFITIDLEALYQEMESLVFNYMPEVYGSETKATLAGIRESGLSTVSLLCNTGFISGITLRKVLKQLELEQYLDFQLYSDEEGLAKPNPAFFQLMLNKINRHKHRDLQLHDVIHVGDNPIADIFGASNVGIDSVQINSNQQSITCLR